MLRRNAVRFKMILLAVEVHPGGDLCLSGNCC